MHNNMWTHTTNHIHYITTEHMYHWDNKLDGFDVGFIDSFIKKIIFTFYVLWMFNPLGWPMIVAQIIYINIMAVECNP